MGSSRSWRPHHRVRRSAALAGTTRRPSRVAPRYQASRCVLRRIARAEIPVHPVITRALAQHSGGRLLVRRVLRAPRIRVRHPHRAQPEHVGEDVVRQRAAEVRQQRGFLPLCARSSRRPTAPTDPRIDARRVNISSRVAVTFTIGSPGVEVAPQRRQDLRVVDATTKRSWQGPPRAGSR